MGIERFLKELGVPLEEQRDTELHVADPEQPDEGKEGRQVALKDMVKESTPSPSRNSDDLGVQLDDLKSSVETLQGDGEATSKELLAIEDRIAELEEKLTALESTREQNPTASKVIELEATIEELRALADRTEESVSELKAELEETRGHLDEAEETLKLFREIVEHSY